MDFKNKISIIVPIYGVEKYIGQCARTVLGQTCRRVEFIFVNDGTPDSSMDILRNLIDNEYSHLKSRIKIIEQPNRGLPSARRAGLKAATGDYIFFVDSDDWIELDAAEQIARCADDTGADMIYFGLYKEKKNKRAARIEKDWNKAGKMEYIKALYTGKTYGYLVIKCFKRSIYEENEVYFPVKGMLEDRYMATQLIYWSKSMYRLERNLYHYRRSNPDAFTRQKRARKRLDSSINMMDLYMHFRDNLSQSPVQDVYRHILYYTAWNAIYFKLPLFDMFPALEEDLRPLPVSRKNLLPLFKQIAVRIYLTFKGWNQRS